MNKTEDRRVRKTKRLLKEGLCKLLKEKSIKEITIQNITDSVDLNRRTFYLHYNDIYDLLESMENDFINHFEELHNNFVLSQDNPKEYIEVLFKYIDDNIDIFKVLLTNKESNFVKKITTKATFNGLKEHNCLNKNSEKSLYLLTFTISGVIGTLKKWASEDSNLSSSEIFALLHDMVSTISEFYMKNRENE